MNIEKLLNTIIEAGKMLVESGAEVNRVEETMVRMCRCFDKKQLIQRIKIPIKKDITISNKVPLKNIPNPAAPTAPKSIVSLNV